MGDGAVWIEDQAGICFPGSAFVLDLYHACDYLGAIKELAAKAEPAHLPEERAPIRAAYRYLSARQNQLNYPEALARGLPVGTGMIESAHKQIIQKRLKGPGMAWLPENANALIRARAHRATCVQNPKCRKVAA